MAETRTTLKTRIEQMVGSTFADTEYHEAINQAIDNAWPIIFQIGTDTSITVDDEVWAYTPTATDITEKGIARVEVVQTTRKNIPLRNHRCANEAGTWKVYLTDRQVAKHDGYGLLLYYYTKYARLDDTTTETGVPSAFITPFAAAWLSIRAMTKEGHFYTEGYERSIRLWQETAERAKRSNASRGLPGLMGYLRQ